jgi:RNA polymerase sigma-70 factor, ECF subfamily
MDMSDRDDTVTRWYLAYAERIYTVLARLLPNPEDRRDVVQETFVRGILRFGDYDSHREAAPWLIAIARNLAVDRLRRGYEKEQRLSEECISNLRSPELSALRRDEAYRLAMAVAALPEREREVVHLYYYRELSVREVADVLQIPAGTVKFRLYRCRSALAAALEEKTHEA